MKIPFFNYADLYLRDKTEFNDLIENVLSRGAYIMQSDLECFERNLAAYLGAKHVLGVADGTMAMIIGLKAMGIEKGDEVILPSHTFVATAAAVSHAGGVPVLAECGKDHLLNAIDVEKRITKNTRVIMPVQLNGRTANMKQMLEIADQHEISIAEDSAQALGSKFDGKCAGTFGDFGICSFYPSKTLGCFGDGGAVVTNSDAIADEVRLLRDHGRISSGDVVHWGFNSRLDNLQAAILNFKLQKYDAEIARRRELAQIYHSLLRNISELSLPPGPDDSVEHFDIYQNYEIECENRDALKLYLQSEGIGTILQWGGKCIHQFEALGLNSDLPITEQVTERFLLLPMNTSLSNDDVEFICEKILSFYM